MELLIALISAAIQAIATFLGFQLTLSPATTPQQKLYYKRAFIALGGAGILVTTGQWWYSSKSDAELKGSINQVREQTRQPPQVTVNVPQPVVQLLPAPQPTPAASEAPKPKLQNQRSARDSSNAALRPPPAPSDIRVSFNIDYPRVFFDLSKLHSDGLALLNAAKRLDHDTYEKDIVTWAGQIISTLTAARQMTDALEMNSDVGLPTYVIPQGVPQVNQVLYHNVWFRVYRLQQFLRRVEKDWLKNVIFDREPSSNSIK
jgi:hypothetical protein